MLLFGGSIVLRWLLLLGLVSVWDRVFFRSVLWVGGLDTFVLGFLEFAH